MKEQFEARFETELTKLKEGLTKKHTTKKASRIHQRIGRYTQKYPSVSKYYDIEVITDDHRLATAINWSKNREKYQNVKDKLGVYFIRTNLPIAKEATLTQLARF